MQTLPELLQTMVQMEGSDLHITTNTPPQVRVHGHLTRLEGAALAPSETMQLAYSVLTDAQKKRFEETLELDFSFGIKGLARFRVNMFNQRGAVGAVYRLIPERIRSFQELSLPAVLATLGLVSAGIATGATTFQLAYMYGTSGPASGGTAVNLVGNQFDPGATVTIGGVSASASVTSSTRIGATTPGRNAGALYDVVVTNPGNPPAVLTKGWFADFLDVPQASPYHAPVETIIRDGITSGCGGGNYCPTSPVTRGQMAVFLLRAEHGSAYVPPPATGTIFGDVTVNTSFADWIEQLYAEGITGGCLGGSPPLYCPDSALTRGQMAVFLSKALGLHWAN